MSCEDQALMPTDRCTRFECAEWKDQVRTMPLLEQNEDGFWVCPKCGYSYGEDAKEGLNNG